MSSIFTLNSTDDFSEKLNIDELYETKKQRDLNQLELYNKILNRVHIRIKTTSRQKNSQEYCWFLVPEVILGVPKYDHASCIAYIIDKLKSNGFHVRYTHPNMLLIYWGHYVPTYVRDEIKKKTGIKINEFGIKEEKIESNNLEEETLDKNAIFKLEDKKESKFNSINNYKPSGKLIYNEDSLFKVQEKVKKI